MKKILIEQMNGHKETISAGDLAAAPSLIWACYQQHNRPELERVHAIICAVLHGKINVSNCAIRPIDPPPAKITTTPKKSRTLARKIELIAGILRDSYTGIDQTKEQSEHHAAYIYGALSFHFNLTEKKIKQ